MNVSRYDKILETVNGRSEEILSVSYNDAEMGEVRILIIHQAI